MKQSISPFPLLFLTLLLNSFTGTSTLLSPGVVILQSCEHLRLEKERNAPILPFHSQHHHAAGSQQNPSLTLLTSRKPYTWQPSFFCSCIFWLNPSLLHCSMLSGFLKAQPRRLYASLTSSQVLQHLQKHKHHHLTTFIAIKRHSSSGLEFVADFSPTKWYSKHQGPDLGSWPNAPEGARAFGCTCWDFSMRMQAGFMQCWSLKRALPVLSDKEICSKETCYKNDTSVPQFWAVWNFSLWTKHLPVSIPPFLCF